MFYIAGVVITFFLAFILLSKNDKTNADKILFFWLIGIGIHLFLYYIVFSGQYFEYPQLLGIVLPFPLIHGPFLYLYTASVTNQSKSWKISSLHFLPVLICFISILNFLQLTNEEKILVFKNQGRGYETITFTTLIAVIISGTAYVIWSLVLLKKHKRNILNQFSYSEKINLIWLRYLIYGIGLIWIFVIYGNDEILFSLVVLFVIFIGYFGINQVGVFSSENKKNLSNSTDDFLDSKDEINISYDTIKNPKYVKSGLNQDTAIEIHKQLKEVMEKNELFTNSELTLAELAEILQVQPNYLSQVINTFENKPFYDYINSKRIDLFLKLIALPENKKYTILSLAFECGFNSKSSFNKHFKKITNQTPSEYLNSIKN
jgi:AraC-like DNA-binding protein